jgi:hypothetical protein
MNEDTRRLVQLAADIDTARARQTPIAPIASGRTVRKAKPWMRREPVGPWLLGGVALVLAGWGIFQSNETARLNLETARLSILPRLEFILDAEKRTLSLHNYGTGPAAVYYVKLTHRDWTIELRPRSGVADDLASFFPVVLSNLYNDPSFSPAVTPYDATRMLADGASQPVFSIDTTMTKAQTTRLAQLPKELKIELCYTNLLGDSVFRAGFGSDEVATECQAPPSFRNGK